MIENYRPVTHIQSLEPTSMHPYEETKEHLLSGLPYGGKEVPEIALADGKKKDKNKGLRNRLGPEDFIAGLAGLFDQPQYQSAQQLNARLEPEYNLSFQNEKNSIIAAHNAALKSAKTSGQKAAISAQMAEQLANVDAKEMQFNEQNKAGIRSRNYAELNRVDATNLAANAEAQKLNLMADANTQDNRFRAAQHISDVIKANKRANNQIAMAEELYRIQPRDYVEPTAQTVNLDSDVKTDKYERDSKGRVTKKETEESYYGSSLPKYFTGGGMVGVPGNTAMVASVYPIGSYKKSKKKKK